MWVVESMNLSDDLRLGEAVHCLNVEVAVCRVTFYEYYIGEVYLLQESVLPIFHREELIAIHKKSSLNLIHVFDVDNY